MTWVDCLNSQTIEDHTKSEDLKDYKFFCFNGVPKEVQVGFDRFTNHKRKIYDLNWDLLDVTIK